MQNPYAPPTSIRNESRVGHRITLNLWWRLLRTVVCGMVGYFTPFAILIPMFAIKYGWHPIGSHIEGLAFMHWPITVAGWALLIPNVCCMIFFGAAGYAKSVLSVDSPRFVRWLSLGIAILIGYVAMLTMTFTFDPWPESWSPERRNLLQSGVTLILPVALSLFWLLARRRQRTK